MAADIKVNIALRPPTAAAGGPGAETRRVNSNERHSRPLGARPGAARPGFGGHATDVHRYIFHNSANIVTLAFEHASGRRCAERSRNADAGARAAQRRRRLLIYLTESRLRTIPALKGFRDARIGLSIKEARRDGVSRGSAPESRFPETRYIASTSGLEQTLASVEHDFARELIRFPRASHAQLKRFAGRGARSRRGRTLKRLVAFGAGGAAGGWIRPGGTITTSALNGLKDDMFGITMGHYLQNMRGCGEGDVEL
ncbi:hypothetical protein EVAR_82962_1 [Eumeta japonica]|uniref:Uncharacterized protein n=1 Tax=Eumeta variegata TaxID=151549 RepID=A0A4C1VRI2_EUMVA|nr:hypothetical protein EVAR_82962_1 [Eumeta japonica]